MDGLMTSVYRRAVVLACVGLMVGASAALAQAPVGNWQGVLENAGLTVILHIDPGGQSALDSPIQGVYGLKATVVSTDSTLDFEVPSIKVTYHGVVRGGRVTGTYSQRGNDVPLVFIPIKSSGAETASGGAIGAPPVPSNLAGIWRGILEGPDLPVVLHINPGGVSTVDSPKQKAFGMRAEVAVRGDSVRFVIPAVRARFHGTISGTTIGGEFSQNGGTLPLTLKRAGG